MPKENRDIQAYLPDLRGLIDARAETKLYAAFSRMYDYFQNELKKLRDENQELLNINLAKQSRDFTAFVGAYAQPLPGGVDDPVLQSIVNSFGEQDPNKVFAGPTPSFRVLVVADIPNLSAAKVPTGVFLLAQLDPKVLKTDDDLTEDVTGAPNINTGKIILKDNDGHSIKVMTCA